MVWNFIKKKSIGAFVKIVIFIADGTVDTRKGRNEAFDNIASSFIDNWNDTADDDDSADVTDAATGMENYIWDLIFQVLAVF